MPVVTSQYKPPILSKKGFVSTVYAGLFRTVKGVVQQRERINLSDGDFLDLDWSFSAEKSSKLIIVLHGLEGNAQRPYMVGTAKVFNANGFDAACVNYRGCSGEENLLYSSYHSGATEDLEAVVNHVLENKNYTEIYVKVLSVGGNLLLKNLGERQNVVISG
ncbi:YheT family hydrolase [Paucihalobacter sp.]|uniref:YheT family hydrolase n=1 Tax=Paucihalobacter sp. TaxID=2850405 RepID=UPI002FE41859